MTRRAVLTLTPTEPAVFSERAATEGAHRSLAHPTGSALLGWAARTLYAAVADSFTVFHSGRVRFSNALPLVEGQIAWPVPRLLMSPKHRAAGISGEGLDAEALRVGRPHAAEPDTQYEALKDWFVTVDGRAVKPGMDRRLRTATAAGRAAKGKLFSFQHIPPAAVDGYQAVVEADDDAVSQGDWDRLMDAFHGRSLRLGRGAGTAYGGHYRCEAGSPAGDPWPDPGPVRANAVVRVWALSDLALSDRFGSACFAPVAETFGLPRGSEFRGAESAIAVRRFAPWNQHLGRRDLERQVIEAGSVLSYQVAAAVPSAGLRSLVGWWRAAGLGRVWIAAPMLSVPRGERPDLPGRPPPLPRPPESGAMPPKPDHELVHWAEAMRGDVR